ncbi:unnamed protein product [Paramecium sonneborni]|uniref:Uncharacterized protein n=1 Tax=Paramecium sonneborni TaxID=65129 RepID=A0A8S1PZ74_9CILI|nr:unnamed protein product [Paramecium sonneborni]
MREQKVNKEIKIIWMIGDINIKQLNISFILEIVVMNRKRMFREILILNKQKDVVKTDEGKYKSS